MGIRRRLLARRWTAALVVLGSIGTGVVPVSADPPPDGVEPEIADWWDDLTSSTPDDDPVAPPVEATESATLIEDEPFERGEGAAVELPAAGVADLTLGGVGVGRQAGDLPVDLAAESAAVSGESVQVEVLDHEDAARAGVRGFAFRVTGDGGAALGSAAGDDLAVTLEVDYSGFKDLYGAGYGDRLRVVALAECAVAEAIPEGCDRAPTLFTSRNDRDAQRLVVEVPDLAAVQGAPPVAEATTAAADAAPVAGGGMVLAVTSGPEGEGGSFEATPLSISGDWQVGVGSGEFSWGYDLPVREAPAGPTPGLGLSYSSGLVDGMVTSRNAQAGQNGLGWDGFDSSFIERRYNSCLDDGQTTFADLCWKNDNATISLNGQASELVPVPGSSPREWRLRSDARWRVEQLTGANNVDNDGEHWKVTTPDGTQYFFGLGENPDWAPFPTDSVLTTPVVGDDPGEPCSTEPLGWCTNQAWRWNLDRVVDRNGNTQTWMYDHRVNEYLSLRSGAMVGYMKENWLETVHYGTRAGSAEDSSARVELGVAFRCSTLQTPDDAEPCPDPFPETGATYPDAPLDLVCGGTVVCTLNSPTFFTVVRYYKAEIFVRTPLWTLVNTVRFTHAFQDPDPATEDDTKLWLTGIQRTGHHPDTGETLTLPPTTFGEVSLDNRFDPGAGESAMPHWRIGSVKDEFGREVNVTYGTPHPCPPPSDAEGPQWHLNDRDCLGVLWGPEGEDPTFRVFNKYLVTQVQVVDTTGGSPSMVTSYAYGNQVAAGLPNAAWHWDDDDFVAQSSQSWSEWRGYQDVLVTQGDTRTRYRVFRGMNGDIMKQFDPDGFRDATISSLDGTVSSIPDDNWLRGRTLDEVSLRADGTIERGTVHSYQAITTVDAPDGCSGCPGDLVEDARWVGENDTVQRLRTPAAGQVFARRRTQTAYNAFLQFPEQVIEHGFTAQAGDERCTATGYVFDPATWMIDFPSSATRYANTSCSGTEVTRSEIAYDAGGFGAAPSLPGGNPTSSRTKLTASPETWATTTTNYDPLGRPLVVTDPNGHTTETTYGSPTGHPGWIETTNHLGHTQRTNLYPVWGVPWQTIDPNGNATDFFYDPLGRATEVFQPTEIGGTDPSWLFSYDIDPERDEVPVIRTRRLQDTAGPGGAARYLDTWVIYDSLLRERQTHTLSPETGKAIVSDTVYDNRGLVADAGMPQAVTGTAGTGVLATPSGGWANRSQTVYDHVGRPSWELVWNSDGLYRHQTTAYTHTSAEVNPMAPDSTPFGTKTLTVTDAYDRTVRVEEHDGTAYRPTVYTYDAADRLATVTDPANNRITYGYDMAGRRTAMDDPDAGDWTYSYDPAGNQTAVTDATGAVVHTIYDDLNRPTERRQTTVAGVLLASWAYDATGELGLLDSSTRHDTTGDWTIDLAGYDTRNRPTGRTWSVPAAVTGLAGTYDVTYGYDAVDHQTSTNYPAVGGLAEETVTTGYNSIGLPETMTGADEYVVAAAYDDRGRPALFGFGQTPSGLAMGKAWAYDNNQRLATMQTALLGGAIAQDRTIRYDLVGNVTERNTTLDAAAWRECYGYDQRQRLTSAWTTGGTCATGTKGTGANPYNHTYAYTHDGNLDARTEGTTNIDYTHPAGGLGSTRPHAPTAVAGDTYTWDANGHLDTRTVGGQTENLTWDAEHRLAAVDDPDGDSAFVYDAAGARLLRQGPDGSTLYIEGHEITAPTSGTTTAVRSYTFGGSLIATRDPSGVDYLATDNQGSVELSVPAGATTPDVTRTYYPYGDQRTGNQLDTDRAWIGQIEDDATNLQYLNNRYYDSTTGVFTSPDPVMDHNRPQTHNPYNYSANNPSTLSDPSGLDPPCFHPGVSCSDDIARGQLYGQAPAWVHERDRQLMEAFIGGYEETLDPVKKFYCGTNGPCGSRTTEAIVDELELWTAIAWEVIFGDYDRCLTDHDVESCLWIIVDFIPGGNAVDAANDARRATEAFNDARRAGDNVEDAADAARAVPRLCSFDGDTRILMADGTARALEEVEVGDWVLSVDPVSGERGPRQVAAVWAHEDQVLDLKVENGGRIVTTEDHSFWNATDSEWQSSEELDSGDDLLTSDGRAVPVIGIDWSTTRSTVAYNLTIDDVHTYFVQVNEIAVLVHNDCVPEGSELAEVLGRRGGTFNSPGEMFEHLNTHHGLDIHVASTRLHAIKRGLSEDNQDIVMGRDGSIYDATSGDLLGNLLNG